MQYVNHAVALQETTFPSFPCSMDEAIEQISG